LNALVRKQGGWSYSPPGGRHDISGKRESLSLSLSLSQHPGMGERESIMSMIKCEKSGGIFTVKS
jgi:hypothetical protein